MPQPFRVTSGFSYSPNPTWVQSHRPECVAAIGLIALSWTRVEEQLGSMISGIFGLKSIGEDGWGISPDWVMQTVMSETDTNHARLKIIDALLQPALKDSPLRAVWDGLMNRLRSRARERNIIVHTGWAWSESRPDDIIQVSKGGTYSAWREKDFIDSQKRIVDLELDLHRFMLSVIEALKAGILSTPYIRPDKIP